MKNYSQEKFIGERALFKSNDLEIDYCTFVDGESPLKESKNIKLKNSIFEWKYPLWYCEDIKVEDSMLLEMARAGIWYTNNLDMKNITIQAPKTFRRCNNMKLENIDMPNANETLWNCKNIKMKNVTAKGPNFAMNSENIEIDGFTLIGDYSFDGGKNITVRNAKMISKDAFWNAENVTVYDSFISGEYFGWNAKNVTLINCTIESLQGFCYMENVVLKNCKLINTNLAFEYSTVDAEIISKIDSVKNPYSGRIISEGIDEIIFDDPKVDSEKTEISVSTADSSLAG
ncbi:DUF3737 family protein [Pectinatus brassicae]|uniref:DUF3737 family protein n=1 Tax=Pectinatus brassicae TaxID=862415 RepID=A0A840UIX6_9FIRM|nr:DUF3737 family protein [Pectinatus brassicae]MBB5337076.1 hypothetical protein [Pectinatus brassicae]